MTAHNATVATKIREWGRDYDHDSVRNISCTLGMTKAIGQSWRGDVYCGSYAAVI